MKYACVAAFLATILAANYLTTEHGMVSVGFGLTATAGTWLAGLSFVLRDSLQDAAGKWAAVAVITAGAVLSFAIADPFIALASASAFLLAELADLCVYTPLRNRGYVRAAITSNVVGAVVDTFVFLTIAGFPLFAWQGQVVGKLTVTAIAVAAVLVYRMRRVAVPA